MSEVSSPKAARQSLPRWLDPKLILGVLFVVVSMVLGAQVVTRADDTQEIWAVGARNGLSVGGELSTDDLVARRVRFTSADDANRYVSASESIPDGSWMVRDVGRGEFLPRGSFTKENPALRDLPIPVSSEHLPAGLGVGDIVDLYIVPDDATQGETTGSDLPDEDYLEFEDVRVEAVGQDGGLGGGGTVTLRVDAETDVISDVAAKAVAQVAVLVRHTAE